MRGDLRFTGPFEKEGGGEGGVGVAIGGGRV